MSLASYVPQIDYSLPVVFGDALAERLQPTGRLAARLPLPGGVVRLVLPGPNGDTPRLIVLHEAGAAATDIYPTGPLDPHVLRRIGDEVGRFGPGGIELLGDPESVRIARALLDGPRELRAFQARVLGHVLVARLLARSMRGGTARPPVAALQSWRLAKVLRFVEERLADPIRLADLARASGLTQMHFAAQFRVATGLTPHDFVQFRRIERAQELIASPRARLAEVALDVGFQAQAHFTTVFRRLTGTTPHRWRRSLPSAGPSGKHRSPVMPAAASEARRGPRAGTVSGIASAAAAGC